MDKTDLAKKYKSYYTAKAEPTLLELEAAQYVSICGKGDPSDVLFAQKIQALYAVAYTIKFFCKWNGDDFIVPKLEALWWFDEKKYEHISMQEAPQRIPRAEWEYRLLIRLPDFVQKPDVTMAVDTAKQKKPLPFLEEIVYHKMKAGKCVQMLHVGPFDREPGTLQQMQAFMQAKQLDRNGVHHEIYLSDFRKTDPAKLRTILREPVLAR